MRKGKKRYAKCPSCITEKHRTEMETSLSILEKTERKEYKHYKELNIDTYKSFIDSNFEWACDDCFKLKKAIVATPGSQIYSGSPHLAYYDMKLICNKCGIDFLFSKEEKKLWYESLGFGLYSIPNNCLKCRKDLRQLKSENTTLSEILKKDESNLAIDELEKIIEIYSDWHKGDKAKYYESLLRKRKKALSK